MNSYVNGVFFTSTTFNWQDTYSAQKMVNITFGNVNFYGNGQNLGVNEIVIWDTLQDPHDVTLVTPAGVTSTGQTLSGAARTGWVDVAQFDGAAYSNPGVSNVLSGTGYTFQGSSLTGAYSPAVSTDPGIANVLSGTGYTINDVSLTGVLVVGGTYTDPGIANVRAATDYIFNDLTLTGTLNVPTASTGTANTVPINELKEQIRFVLSEANTTTGSPIDVSENLAKRVQLISKVNPEKIMMQGHELPALTIYTSRKTVDPATISQNLAIGKRKGKVTLTLAGLVWIPYTSNTVEDPADEDLEVLMENAERVLRSFPTLADNANWHFPTDVTYHSAAFDEQSHYRIGLMDIDVTVLY